MKVNKNKKKRKGRMAKSKSTKNAPARRNKQSKRSDLYE